MDAQDLQSNPTDGGQTLTARFRNGDDAAFDEVVRLYGPDIQRLVHRLFGWRIDNRDVVQDVFVAALANRRKFKGDASLKTWLFTIAVNRCRSLQRRQALRRRFRGQFHSQIRNVEESAAEQEQIEKLQAALRRLPAKYRDVIVLKYLEELPTSEILCILKIRQSTFYTRLNRAKKQLRQGYYARWRQTDE